MAGIQVIYEWYSFITKVGRPIRSIWDEKMIELAGIVEASNLRGIFNCYQLGWMTTPGFLQSGGGHRVLCILCNHSCLEHTYRQHRCDITPARVHFGERDLG